MSYVFFCTKKTAKDKINPGIDFLLCYATLRTTFFNILNGVSSIKEDTWEGYLAVYIIAKDAPILNSIYLTFFPK
jgi:hypothetical protein